jgi:hypothetical protein
MRLRYQGRWSKIDRRAIALAVSLSFRQLVWIKALRSQKILKLRSPSLFGYRPFF